MFTQPQTATVHHMYDYWLTKLYLHQRLRRLINGHGLIHRLLQCLVLALWLLRLLQLLLQQLADFSLMHLTSVLQLLIQDISPLLPPATGMSHTHTHKQTHTHTDKLSQWRTTDDRQTDRTWTTYTEIHRPTNAYIRTLTKHNDSKLNRDFCTNT